MDELDRIVAGPKWKKNEPLDRLAISKVITNGFIARRRDSKDTTKKTFSPSGIGGYHGVCPRYWVQAFNGAWFDERNDALSINVMNFGNYGHEVIQEVLEEQGILIESEVEITMDSPPIRGYVDALVNWENETVVCEIKTTRMEAFQFRELSGKPSAQHLIQLLIYLKATGNQRGFLLYMNKNDQRILVIPVELDEKNEKIIEDVFAWLNKVRDAWDKGLLPKRPFRKEDNKTCNSCPVQKMCWSGPEGDIKIAKMEVPSV